MYMRTFEEGEFRAGLIRRVFQFCLTRELTSFSFPALRLVASLCLQPSILPSQKLTLDLSASLHLSQTQTHSSPNPPRVPFHSLRGPNPLLPLPRSSHFPSPSYSLPHRPLRPRQRQARLSRKIRRGYQAGSSHRSQGSSSGEATSNHLGFGQVVARGSEEDPGAGDGRGKRRGGAGWNGG